MDDITLPRDTEFEILQLDKNKTLKQKCHIGTRRTALFIPTRSKDALEFIPLQVCVRK